MDCESCGRHRPSDQIVATRSSNGMLQMLCGRCRRHLSHRPVELADIRSSVRPTLHPAFTTR